MMHRYIRMFAVLFLAVTVVMGPVAPVFAQQQSQAPQQGQAQQGQTQQGQTQQGGTKTVDIAPPEQSAPPAPPQPKSTSDKAPPEYLHGKPAFPNLLAPYSQISVPQPNFKNSAHLSQFIGNGKLTVSLQDCIALALENSIDIEVERYAPWIADTNVLATAGGLDSNYNYDPIVTMIGGAETQNSPIENPLLSGLNSSGLSALTTHSAIGDVSYSQGFESGTQMTITQTNTRESTEGENVFNPSVSSGLSLRVTQQFLNGFGILPNARYIRVAQVDQKISEYPLQEHIITTVTAVENDYWNLVYAIQNIDVANKALEAAQDLYNSNLKQEEIGTMAPLDVTTAKAQVATEETALIEAQTTRRQNEEILLAAITRDPLGATQLNLEIVPTDSTYIPEEVEKIPLDQAVREALANRPDFKEIEANVDVDDINVRANKKALLPTLSVTGTLSWAGLAGVKQNPAVATGTFIADTSDPIVTSTGLLTGDYLGVPVTTAASPATTSTGLGTALDQIFTNQFPTYGFAATLSVPIRNRQAQAASEQSILQKRQDQTKVQQSANQIVLAIREAQIALEQARATLTSAIQTRELEKEAYDDEVKKLELGVSTPLNVVTIENTYVAAAGAEVQARVNLVEAKVNFDNVMGRIFQVNNITVAGVKHQTPAVARDTLIPGTNSDGSLVVGGVQNQK
jgi:outer membrane protein